MSDQSSPEKSPWGWKAVSLFGVVCALFLGFFWLAMNNEPDYMPSQQRKAVAPTEHSTAQKSAHDMTAAEHGMTEEQHANMSEASAALPAHTGNSH